jgi:conjugative transfer region lipoprotein (TIGR03751 family)
MRTVMKIKKIAKTTTKIKSIKYFSLGILSMGVLVGLSGCASSNPPVSGYTEAQVYEMAMKQSDAQSLGRIRNQVKPIVVVPPRQTFTNFDGTAKQAQSELNKMFPKLPNPQTTVYVAPHLGPDGVPVPGYYTTFHLYNKNHYALPGEIGMKR